MFRLSLAVLLISAPALAQEEPPKAQMTLSEMLNSIDAELDLRELPIGDPTQPPDFGDDPAIATDELRSGALTLQEILISPERRLAIVNDQTLAIGDWIDGATVVAIESYRIWLRRSGENIILSLSGAPVKEPAEDPIQQAQ